MKIEKKWKEWCVIVKTDNDDLGDLSEDEAKDYAQDQINALDKHHLWIAVDAERLNYDRVQVYLEPHRGG
jgi:hypothetical protein